MQVRSDREWENADNDDFDRRDARDSYERRDYDDARMDYDRRDVPPPREDRGRGRPSAPQYVHGRWELLTSQAWRRRTKTGSVEHHWSVWPQHPHD